MAWSKNLTQLRDALAYLIPFREDAITYLTDASIAWQNIALPNQSRTMWHNILVYAEACSQVDELLAILLITFPNNPHIIAFKESLTYSLGSELTEADWKGVVKETTLEKIIEANSTLLPISFLQVGLRKAKSVARVLIEKPEGTEAGTGFKLNNNLFLTNNHVIPDIATAKIAKIQFDYEESENGLPIVDDKKEKYFELDADNGFATSVENDWTVVRIKSKDNALEEYGYIELKKNTIKKDDFVNIIQHPGGRFKQIAMYHNLVTFSDDNIIQYLTDTEPGSSGSPVFNSKWEVVALHHSGGMLKEPNSKQNLLRNEGISINKIIDGLIENNLTI